MPDDTPHIIIVGNPLIGFTFFGPFENREVASEVGIESEIDNDWYVAPIKKP